MSSHKFTRNATQRINPGFFSNINRTYQPSHASLKHIVSSKSATKLRSTEPLKISDLDTTLKHRRSPVKVKVDLNIAKLHRFSIIFKLFNPDSQGRLHSKRILNLKLNKKLEYLLSPIIEDISKWPKGISYREFCLKMDVLLKYLPDEDKYFLLSPTLYTPKQALPNRHRVNSPEHKAHAQSFRRTVSPFLL